MRVLLAGGGTGGHINPAIAIANAIREKEPSSEIAFIGTKKGLENQLVPKAGYPLYPIEMHGLQRRLTLENFKTLYDYFAAPRKAEKLLLEWKPDIVIGTGGYVCWAPLHAAAKLGIPTAVHESNAIPGKAVKMLENEIDRIYTNFEATAKLLTAKDKILCVGNPLISPPKQGEEDDIAAIRTSLGIPSEIQSVILSFGGSLGAERINEEALTLMTRVAAKDPTVFHVHATGRSGYADFLQKAEAAKLTDLPNVRIAEFLYDMPAWERVADVVICRAGAMTLSEMALLGRACVIIPSPNVVNNHQYENAKRLADKDAAVLIEEKHLTPDLLEASVRRIRTDAEFRRSLRQNIRTFANPNAKDAILRDIDRLLGRDVFVLLDRHKKK